MPEAASDPAGEAYLVQVVAAAAGTAAASANPASSPRQATARTDEERHRIPGKRTSPLASRLPEGGREDHNESNLDEEATHASGRVPPERLMRRWKLHWLTMSSSRPVTRLASPLKRG